MAVVVVVLRNQCVKAFLAALGMTAPRVAFGALQAAAAHFCRRQIRHRVAPRSENRDFFRFAALRNAFLLRLCLFRSIQLKGRVDQGTIDPTAGQEFRSI